MCDIKQWCKKETLVNKMKVLKSLFLIIYRLMADTIAATGVTGNEVVDVNTVMKCKSVVVNTSPKKLGWGEGLANLFFC